MNNPRRLSSPGRHTLPALTPGTSRYHQVLTFLLVITGLTLVGHWLWKSVSAAENLTITTVAGGGTGSGLAAEFQSARGIATSADGNTIFIADAGNHVVRRVNLTFQTIEIIAGISGQAGFIGDGGNSTSATLNNPSDVVFDESGNFLYIADTGNNRIRKLDLATNVITTLSGTATAGSSDGAIGTATFNQPRGLGRDGNGDIYVADTGGHVVRRINLGAQTVQTLAGTNGVPGNEGDGAPAINATLSSPQDVAVDSSGNIYIADTGNNRIRRVSGGTISAYAGGGNNDNSSVPTQISMNAPAGIAVEQSFVYISDTSNHRLRRINTVTSTADILAGSGDQGFNGDGTASGVGARNLNLPIGVAVAQSGGTIYLLDSGSRRLRKVTPINNTIATVVSDGSSGFSGDGGAATQARLSGPRGVATDSQGNFYIADTDNHVIRFVNKSTGAISTIAGTPGVASASATGSNGDGGLATAATFSNPTDVVVDSLGNIYISDTGNNRIRRIDLGGNIETVLGERSDSPTPLGGFALNGPQGIAIDSSDTLYIANTGGHQIFRLLANGTASVFAGTGIAGPFGDSSAATSAQLNQPGGVGVDSAGNVYIADTGNNRVRVVSGGIMYPFVNTGLGRDGFQGDGGLARLARLTRPTDVFPVGTNKVYIADRGNDRVRLVTINNTNGTPQTDDDDTLIETVIGNGNVGFTGDGGAALNAALGLPYGITVNNDGVYLADTGNNRIRRATAPPNSNPSLAVTCNGGACASPVTVAEGQSISITLQGTDPDAAQTLTYSMRDTATNQPLVSATLSPTTGASSTFTYTPDFTVAPNQANGEANFTVEFTVTDSGSPAKSATQTVNIKVTNVNRNPTASITNPASSPTSIEATSASGATVALAGTATDPDGDTLAVQWKDNGNDITGATNLTPSVPLGPGSHPLTLTATDPLGGTVTTAAKTINIVDTTVPVFSSIPADISVPLPQGQSGVNVDYVLPTVSDSVSGSCTVGGNPCSLTVSPADKTPNAFFPAGETIVTFKATDGAGNMATASFKVVVGTGGSSSPANYRINSFAGSGNFGNSGNAGPAANAAFKQPYGMAIDSNGNVYVADTLARVVRRINAADGVISNFAGTGEKGSSGDGGQAILAKLHDPTGLAVDSQNNLYIADTGNHVIRKVNVTTGLISTVAGSFQAGNSGDNGLATNARLNLPTGIALDLQGNLYIADTGNHRIRKVTAADSLIATIAGLGIAGFSGDGNPATSAQLDTPTGVAVTSDGTTIYIADQHNHRIRRIVNNNISTFAGNGQAGFSGDGALAGSASLYLPTDVEIDPDSNLLITDTGNDRIRRVTFGDQFINTLAGTGAAGNTGDGGLATDATLDTPNGLAIDRRTGTAGEVYFADSGNIRVRRLTINNAPPVPTTVSSQVVRKDRTLDVPLSAADADGDPVTFSIVSATNLSFLSIVNANPSARTATLRINPGGGNVGSYNLQIRATDSRQASTLTPQFTITISENQAPQACIVGGSQISISSGPVTLVIDGRCSTDPDSDPLTYQWKEGTTALGSSSTIAPTLNPGTHDITLTVSDGLLTNSFTQRIIVGGGNTLQAVINGPSSVNSASGSPVSATFDGLSSTGSPTSYLWKVDGNTTAGNTSSTFTTSLAVGTHTIELTVGNGSTTSTATKSVTVTFSATAPTACIVGGATQSVTSTNGTNAVVSLSGSCSTGQGTLTYEWSEGATVLGMGVSISPTLTVGSHTIKLKVTNSQNQSSEATQTVTVQSSGGTPLCGDGQGMYICPQGVNPSAGRQGQTLEVVIDGSGFQQGATVSFSGDGITTNVKSVTSVRIVMDVTIANNATVGTSNTTRRILSVRNPTGQTVSTGRIFGVLPR